MKVIDTPGHTTSHIVYYVASAGAAFVGDTIFVLGCGRLFEGTPAQMHNSLQIIAGLPGETKLYCAHEYTLSNAAFAVTVEPRNADLLSYVERAKALRADNIPTVPTTVAAEKRANPFVRAASAAQLGEIRAAKFLGWVMAVGTDKPTQVELGWRLIQKSWGKGYVREAVCKVIDHVVRHHPETQFIASIHPENLGSIKVAKIAGMRLNQETITDASFEKIFTLTKTQFFSREKLKS